MISCVSVNQPFILLLFVLISVKHSKRHIKYHCLKRETLHSYTSLGLGWRWRWQPAVSSALTQLRTHQAVLSVWYRCCCKIYILPDLCKSTVAIRWRCFIIIQCRVWQKCQHKSRSGKNKNNNGWISHWLAYIHRAIVERRCKLWGIVSVIHSLNLFLFAF